MASGHILLLSPSRRSMGAKRRNGNTIAMGTQLQRVRAFTRAVISLLLLAGILSIGKFLIYRPLDNNSLRFGAQARGLFLGAAVAVRPLKNDIVYANTLAREFNMVVPENAMKFAPLQPHRGEFNFAGADAIVDFAIAHDMQVRGHTLVWHRTIPQWLTKGAFSSNQIAAILKEHIQTVVGRYRGRIYAWDVVNEAIDENAELRKTFWLNALGPDYITHAFVWAHEADPHAKLFYNDYGGEALGPKSDAIYNLLRNLKMRSVPIDGIGLQSHLAADHPPDFNKIVANLRRLAALGLEIHVTEFDAGLPLPVNEEKLNEQADVYRRLLQACLSILNCKAFVMWGFTDKHSWLHAAALPFDATYRPKPAYYALHNVLYRKIQ